MRIVYILIGLWLMTTERKPEPVAVKRTLH
jgi:hypothetical protein